ncbi:MAG: class I SAM-dependent methyltransferase [Armatimonadota bacterium]
MSALALNEREMRLPSLPVEVDLFGRVVMDHFTGRTVDYFIRRSDNYLQRENSARYFRTWEQLAAHQRCLLSHARGRVLDLGAGAGSHALILQERGLEVTAIDASPLAIEVCRVRGVGDCRVMDANALEFPADSYDSVLMLGNTLSIAGTPDGLRSLLLRLHNIVRPGGQILAEINDYTNTRDTLHLRYHRRNRELGRYPGSLRMRLEYQGKCGPEFDWLLIELADLRKICTETGWKIGRCVQVDAETTYAIGMLKA